MTESEVQQAIYDVIGGIAPEAEPGKISPDENLREALDIDSFDFLNLLIGLHERLGVQISEADYGKLTTMSALVHYLLSKIAARTITSR